jgi:hypothetical protein
MHYRKEFVVHPNHKVRLNKLDPAYKGKHESEAEAKQETEHSCEKLAHQQALLYAERKYAILVVLQALDVGGKDGTVNHVFATLNPQGARVAAFRQPTPAELAHDFLWRVHPHTPARGEIAALRSSVGSQPTRPSRAARSMNAQNFPALDQCVADRGRHHNRPARSLGEADERACVELGDRPRVAVVVHRLGRWRKPSAQA